MDYSQNVKDGFFLCVAEKTTTPPPSVLRQLSRFSIFGTFDHCRVISLFLAFKYARHLNLLPLLLVYYYLLSKFITSQLQVINAYITLNLRLIVQLIHSTIQQKICNVTDRTLASFEKSSQYKQVGLQSRVSRLQIEAQFDKSPINRYTTQIKGRTLFQPSRTILTQFKTK